MFPQLLPSFIAFGGFAWLGLLVSKRLPQPSRAVAWLGWIAALIVAGRVMTSAQLISAPGFTVNVTECLQGLVAGCIAGFILREGGPSQHSAPKQPPPG